MSVQPVNEHASRRLHEFVSLARELSLASDPHDMIESYRARARFLVPADHAMSFSRKGLSDGSYRMTRSTRWKETINPWRQPDRLPTFRGGLIGELLDAGQPELIPDLRVSPHDPVAPYFDGMGALVAVPVFEQGEPIYLTVLMRAERAAFSVDDLATLVLTTNLVGRATSQLVTARELSIAYAALDREFSAVGSLQRNLLPAAPPQIPGMTIATHYETSARAGGDYYDFFRIDETRWGIILADVSGHGAAAAVVVAMMHAYLRTPLERWPVDRRSPQDILGHLNTELGRSIPSGQFVTALLCIYDAASRSMYFASAGHHRPRLLRADRAQIGDIEIDSGLPLAIVEDDRCPEAAVRVSPGDRIVLYTDGVTETFSAEGAMFGVEGIDAALRCCARTPDGIIRGITGALREFAPGSPADDRTLIALAFD